MSSEVGGVPDVGSGGCGSLIEAWGPGKEIGVGGFVGGGIYTYYHSLLPIQ